MSDPGDLPNGDLEAEVARLRDALEREQRISEQWRRVAEERRVAMERLRQRRVVRILFSVGKVVLPFVRRWRHRVAAVERRARSFASGLVGARHRITAGSREARLRRAVAGLAAPPDDPRRVAAIVLTRDGREHLECLLPALRRVDHPALDIVVIDNASGPETSGWLAQHPDIRVIRNDSNLSFSEANDRAVRENDADAVVFLNDDVEPLDEHWLGRMLARLDGSVAAVGAQLVYPRRALLDGRTRDVSVQHLGIGFEPSGDGPPKAANLGLGQDPDPALPAREVAAATAACLLVDRAAYLDVGGFDFRYEYGAEDVDLCWRLRRAGYRIEVQPTAVLWHREGATRHRDDIDRRAARQARNWDRFADRFGPELRHAVDADRMFGQQVLSGRPFGVGITVTRDLESAGYGDWYTAHELGDELARLGWQVRYLERYRDAWYDDVDGLDAVIVLHDVCDIRRLNRPGLTTIAWIRNWTDRWTGHPWFDEFDVVVASSATSAGLVRDASRRREVPVIPLATNPSRFRPTDGSRDGAVLTANHWGEDRGIEALVTAVPSIRLYGKGWDEVPAVAAAWGGAVPYDELPEVYGRHAVVVDQTAAPTRPFGALNSRVFDALACGTLVVTDQTDGARELFGDDLPTYDGPSDLATVLAALQSDPVASEARAARLRDRVISEHTWSRRAEQFRDLIAAHRRRPSVVVRIGAPNRREAANWGDTFFAESLVAEFRAAGHHAIIQTLDEWDDRRGRGFDISLQLKGRSRLPRSEGQVHAIWVISHPDEVDPSELEVADVVFVASQRLADDLRQRLQVPVHVLLQATDERRFRPRAPDPRFAHDVVFVGNSRFVERPLIRDALAAGLDLAIYGANWEKFVPPDRIAGTFVPNEDVSIVYSSAAVVLNDHWPDMREWGLISNRVFDALACGACVVSDPLPELDELFPGIVATAEGPQQLRAAVEGLLDDDAERRRRGAAGRTAVLAAHTFRHRADTILEAVAALAGQDTSR